MLTNARINARVLASTVTLTFTMWHLSCHTTKLTKWHVRPAKTQTSACASAQSNQGLNLRPMVGLGPKVSLCGQRGLWSDWADAQADPSLRWAHVILLVLTCCCTFKNKIGPQRADNFTINTPSYISKTLKSVKASSILILTVPKRYFSCGSSLLLVLAVRIYTPISVTCFS